MFKKNWPFILAGTFVLALVAYFYYLYNQSPTLNWTPNFDHTSSTPYGNQLLHKMMKSLYPEKDFVTVEEPLIYNRAFNNRSDGNNIYFFSAETFTPDKATTGILSKFIREGNQVFISAGSVSKFFFDSLLHPGITGDQTYFNALPQLQCLSYKPEFLHPDLQTSPKFRIKYRVMKVNFPMSVGYVSQSFIDEQLPGSSGLDYYRMGYFQTFKTDSFTNYIKIKVGKGWLHVYTTPLVFTNYYLRKKEVFDYTKNVFLHLEPGNIYWHVNNYQNSNIEQTSEEPEKNPFGVLLSFDSLRYAWYSFLTAILLFCLFGSKRKQRPIPVLERNTNTSIEFAETISKLYLADGRHKNIALQKYRYFFNFVKTRYGINLRDDRADDKNRLAYICKIPIDHVEQIMVNYKVLESLPDTKPDELQKWVKLINEFYVVAG